MNHHQYGGRKQEKLTLSKFGKVEVWNSVRNVFYLDNLANVDPESSFHLLSNCCEDRILYSLPDLNFKTVKLDAETQKTPVPCVTTVHE